MFAATATLGIGRAGGLPWPRLKADLAHFRKVTSEAPAGQRNAVVMGFKTFESLGRKPLPGRLNLVLTRRPPAERPADSADLRFVGGLEEARAAADGQPGLHRTFVIGGAEVFHAVFDRLGPDAVEAVHWNRVLGDFPADVSLDARRLKAFLARMKSVRLEGCAAAELPGGGETAVEFYRYSSEPGESAHPERQYLDLIRELLAAPAKTDRTGVGVREKFGHMFRFDLAHSFPLLTTKRTFFRGVVEELLWFLRGGTDARQLAAKGVRIWDDNSTEEFLRARGLPYAPGDLGPVYGFQWRHFGAEYSHCGADYAGQGVDQLRRVLEELRRDPDSRRLLVSAWNPLQLDRMALPPCHVLFQFHVAHGRLNLALYQRSCDLGLGVPFNIASYALLLCLAADYLGLRRGEFVHFLGSAHVYLNHEEALRRQLERLPLPFPLLRIRRAAPKPFIDAYESGEIALEGYLSHESVRMKMAV